MSNVDIARALKDKDYFNSLTDEEKALVESSRSSGEVDLTDETLDSVSGGLGGDVDLATGTGSSPQFEDSGAAVTDAICNCNC